jgi:hypothetical protein
MSVSASVALATTIFHDYKIDNTKGGARPHRSLIGRPTYTTLEDLTLTCPQQADAAGTRLPTTNRRTLGTISASGPWPPTAELG